MKDKTVIVFSPHPDDETLGCGGTIAKRLSEGCEVIVVLLTDGRHAYSKLFGMDADLTREELMRTRKVEVTDALGILGLEKENLVFLDFEDGTLSQKEDEAEKQVIKILMEHPPVEVYCAYGKDVHPDHRATSRIVRISIKKAGLSLEQYEYSISSKYGRLGRLVELSLNHIRHNKLVVDISPFLHLKAQAIGRFRSQTSPISKIQERAVIKDVARFLKNKETFFIYRREGLVRTPDT